jgi:hypothetical protein
MCLLIAGTGYRFLDSLLLGRSLSRAFRPTAAMAQNISKVKLLILTSSFINKKNRSSAKFLIFF